jgi:hypothetical protein
MKERPILFSAPMVRAILEGRNWPELCHIGGIGDRLWVRETWCGFTDEPYYRATAVEDGMLPEEVADERWKPSIHMPRRASRIDLEVTGVRVERLQDISAEDCTAEGLRSFLREHDAVCDLRDQFRNLWESINGPESWASNPWVWAVEFKRTKP